jgi:hypothetical protein
MYQQLWGYKVEEKLYLGVCEQKRLNTTGLSNITGVGGGGGARLQKYDSTKAMSHNRFSVF